MAELLMNDIQSRREIDLLVREFYKKATVDSDIGHFFTSVVKLDWDEHIPKIVSFWENILLGGSAYQGNPMVKHIELNHLSPIQRSHFDRWLALWEETVRTLFTGPIANEAILRAKSIAYIMLLKIQQHGSGN